MKLSWDSSLIFLPQYLNFSLRHGHLFAHHPELLLSFLLLGASYRLLGSSDVHLGAIAQRTESIILEHLDLCSSSPVVFIVALISLEAFHDAVPALPAPVAGRLAFL